MRGLLTIPTSNANPECSFSMLRKIQTAQRSSLSCSIILALMTMKFDNKYCYFSSKLPDSLLKDCNKGTDLAVKKFIMPLIILS